MLSRLGGTTTTRLASMAKVTISKAYFGSKAPGRDPLALIRDECHKRKLCDEYGFRRPGVHWVFSVAVTPDDPSQPPNLRTVGVQRVSPDGIDFVMKKGGGTCDSLAAGRPIAILHLQGRYMPGETAEQWRGEGYCERLPLDGLKDLLPHYTIASMVSSKRIEKENSDIEKTPVGERLTMENKSHATEIIQKTRLELENGDITNEEIDAAIRAFRFHPKRLECMIGGPDSILWERWEWSKDDAGQWKVATPLLSH